MKKISMLLNSKWKKVAFWLSGSIALFVAIAYLSGLVYVEYLLQSSYRNTALGLHKKAAIDSGTAVLVAQLLYPSVSKRYQDIFLYDLKLWSKMGMIGSSFSLTSYRNFTVEKMIEFEERNKAVLSYEEMARIKIEGARIANATTHGDGVYLVLDIANKLSTPNNLLTAHAKEEVAFRHLTGTFFTFTPQNKHQRKQNMEIAETASKEHVAAQEKICKADSYQCHINNLRWDIGVCIRRAYLNESPVCEPETLYAVTNFTGLACKDFSATQCHEIMYGLLPYYHQLLQAQGKGFIQLLKLLTLADEMPRELMSKNKNN